MNSALISSHVRPCPGLLLADSNPRSIAMRENCVLQWRYGPMVHEMIDGTYRQTNLPNESPEYLAKREELRLAEIELLNARERVAALRRGLPKGATVQDYEFLDCNAEALPHGRATAPGPNAEALPNRRATAPDL